MLIEEQAKQSNHILTQHTNNLEVSLKDVGANLEEMSAKVATNLTKNSETLEQHMTNAVFYFDALLGNTTKTLQENLQTVLLEFQSAQYHYADGTCYFQNQFLLKIFRRT